jgi:hypothetical protein
LEREFGGRLEAEAEDEVGVGQEGRVVEPENGKR